MPLLSVLMAAASGHAVGGLWYSQYAFQKPWMEYSGKRSEDVKKLGVKPHFVCLASDLTLACMLEHAVPKIDIGSAWKTAAMVTGGATLLFATLSAPGNAYEDKHCYCVSIDLGYNAARIGVMTLLLMYLDGRFE